MIKVIPAIDIIDGKCVRLTKGNFDSQKIYNENPLKTAKEFEEAGIKRIHLVDLDGAKQGNIVNRHILEEIASNTGLIIDFGGGIKSEENLKIAFDCGAAKVTVGSIAVNDRYKVTCWLAQYGSDRIIIGADVKDNMIAINAWQKITQLNVISFIEEYYKTGARQIICTDISKDGLLKGPAFDLYKTIKGNFPKIDLTASGGISSIMDIQKLDKLKIDNVIIGKALYENRIEIEELKPFLC
jgi:phosphoribosylformimino-5-aminoimidazole carboxamide ribotide isomerase